MTPVSKKFMFDFYFKAIKVINSCKTQSHLITTYIWIYKVCKIMFNIEFLKPLSFYSTSKKDEWWLKHLYFNKQISSTQNKTLDLIISELYAHLDNAFYKLKKGITW